MPPHVLREIQHCDIVFVLVVLGGISVSTGACGGTNTQEEEGARPAGSGPPCGHNANNNVAAILAATGGVTGCEKVDCPIQVTVVHLQDHVHHRRREQWRRWGRSAIVVVVIIVGVAIILHPGG